MNTKNTETSSSQNDDEEMTKYAVNCKCAHGQRPKEEEMTKLADGTSKCPHCGRRYEAKALGE